MNTTGPRRLLRSVLFLGLLPAAAWAGGADPHAAPAPTPAPETRPGAAAPADILATASAAGNFRTLAAAVQAAGLTETLRGKGPHTVFAPTDDAFARLPAGTVESLLEPANRDRLREILAFHVVAGRVLSSDLLARPTARTLGGAALPIGLRVGTADVTAADILCTNGVIHVIDEVLLPPPAPAAPATSAAAERVLAAIERGVPLFNSGDAAGCAQAYEDAVRALLALPADGLGIVSRADLTKVAAATASDPSARAWDLRRALDRVLEEETFEPLIEAPMPAAFPAPGPLGRVVEKSYPVYRAARAEGGRAAFWTLFQHIQRNEIAMTAPVEMTMGDGMRTERMAFLYERTSQGAAGADGAVEVADLPAMTVLSVAMRGPDDRASMALARAAIEQTLASGAWRPAGAWRVLGYNSPMVPAARRTWELQVPVTR